MNKTSSPPKPPSLTTRLRKELDDAWSRYQTDSSPESREKLYKAILKLATTLALYTFKEPNEDAAQDATIAVLEAQASYRNKSKFSTWAWSIIQTQCRRAFVEHSATKRQSLQLEALPESKFKSLLVDQGIKVEAQERISELDKAKLRLSPAQKRVAAMKLDGYSNAEIAAALGLELDTIKKTWLRVLEGADGED